MADWIVGGMEGHLPAMNMNIANMALTPAGLTQLVDLVRDGSLTLRMAKQILPELMKKHEDVQEYINTHNCFAITDRIAFEQIVKSALRGEEEKVKQYKNGAKRLLGYFIGKDRRTDERGKDMTVSI